MYSLTLLTSFVLIVSTAYSTRLTIPDENEVKHIYINPEDDIELDVELHKRAKPSKPTVNTLKIM